MISKCVVIFGQHAHPYLSAIVNNGSLQYYDHATDGTAIQLGGCTFRFRNMEEDTLIAVAYVDNIVTGVSDTLFSINRLLYR